jgi:hypothetical protein
MVENWLLLSAMENDVLLSFNFYVIFNSMYFCFSHVKQTIKVDTHLLVITVYLSYFYLFGGMMPHFLFFIFLYFITYIHTFIQSHSFKTIIRRHSLRPLSISSSLVCSVGEPPCGAELRIELGPALQQADALPTEPHRTILFDLFVLFAQIVIDWSVHV